MSVKLSVSAKLGFFWTSIRFKNAINRPNIQKKGSLFRFPSPHKFFDLVMLPIALSIYFPNVRSILREFSHNVGSEDSFRIVPTCIVRIRGFDKLSRKNEVMILSSISVWLELVLNWHITVSVAFYLWSYF